MELSPPPPPTPEDVSRELARIQQVQEVYAHVPFSANPKKELIQTSLKRLKLLPPGDLLGEILPDLLYGNDEIRAAAVAKYEAHQVAILEALETDTHVALMESFEYRYQGTVLQHCHELIKEYDCTTPSEKALCEIAAGAFVEHLASKRKFKDLLGEDLSLYNRRTSRPTMKYSHEYEETWTLAQDRLRLASLTAKEVGRSARRYQSVIAQLAQMKSPVPEVHIQTAFLAQHQQFNAPRTI